MLRVMQFIYGVEKSVFIKYFVEGVLEAIRLRFFVELVDFDVI